MKRMQKEMEEAKMAKKEKKRSTDIKKLAKRVKRLGKKAKGVTMLALVVTIIVLLILAAITLNLAVGENGIIERAKLARDKAKNASIEEEEAMNLAAGEIDNAGNSSGGDGGGTCPECPDTKPLEDRIKELESQVGVLQQQLEEERANKQELENRITELNNQIAELNKQIEAGNIEKAKLQAEITKLQNQLTATQTENERLQAQIAELNKQIEAGNTQIGKLEAEITKLQNQLTASQTENEKLRAQITELNKQVTNLNTQLGEKNKTIETQKQQIANLQGQITEKDKVISQKNETIKTMQSTIDGLNTQIANLNKQIETLKAKQATGNAVVSDVLAGKTFSNSNGVGLVGTMANNGAISKTLNAGGSYTIPAGYHNGSGTVTAASLASQTGGTATAGDILEGKTAWVNGNKVTGTNAGGNLVNTNIKATISHLERGDKTIYSFVPESDESIYCLTLFNNKNNITLKANLKSEDDSVKIKIIRNTNSTGDGWAFTTSSLVAIISNAKGKKITANVTWPSNKGDLCLYSQNLLCIE